MNVCFYNVIDLVFKKITVRNTCRFFFFFRCLLSTNNVTTWNFGHTSASYQFSFNSSTGEVTLQCRTSSDWRKLPWKFISWPFCEVVVVVIDVSTVQDILKKVLNVAFIQKVLVNMLRLQTQIPNYCPELKFWIFFYILFG